MNAVHAAVATMTGSARELAPSLRLKEDLGIDSLEFVELIQLIEQKLSIQVNDDAVASVRDVGSLVGAVETSLREARAAAR
ncbi:MAG: acyl carrier protein [Xanthobacteraceae bacterium]|nr:acyl carrier protein [Xanthobacteraceae bacterium]